MVKSPRSEKTSLKKRPWSAEEDQELINYIKRYGIWNWTEMPKSAGLSRSGKSCRLRWLNYLRPGVKRGNFSQEEDQIIIKLHEQLGNKWNRIAATLPGRTDNDIKNHWHTHLKKRLTNNQVQSTSLKKRQKATVEVNQNINLPEVDRFLPNYPLNFNGCKGPPSYLLNPEIYRNQTTEANNFSYKQIQSLSERLPPVEGLYNDYYEAAFAHPESMVLTSQWELLKDTNTCYDGGFDLWD